MILLFLSMVGIFLSVIIVTFNARKNTATRYLGSFFFLVSLYVFSEYGLIYSKSVLLVTVLLVIFPIVFSPLYLTGPMLYWYVRSVLSDNARLRKSDFFHLLPMVIYLMASLPFTFLPVSEKAELAKQVVDDVGIMQTYAATYLSEIFPVSATYLSRPVILLTYAIWSIVLIVRYFYQGKLAEVFLGQAFMLKWLLLLNGFVLLLTTSHILDINHTFEIDFADMAAGLNPIRFVSVLGLVGLTISPFLFPAILYGLPRFPVAEMHTVRETGTKIQVETRKSVTRLERDYLHSVGQRMDAHMQKQQPFLQPQFNLNQLAVQIGVPVHHLAYYFREVKKQTFSDYRNAWRVEHAKKLIRAGKSIELTLEAIAELSGFSNRNAFRSVFQRTEGICPSTFAAQQKETA
jgi:AraC-like DNA-binding protein